MKIAGRVRLAASAILFSISLLVLFPAPTYILWEAEIGAGEMGHFLALAALAMLIPGWRKGKLSAVSATLALAAFCIEASPLIRAGHISRSLPARLDLAFGPGTFGARGNARAATQPLSLRMLFTAPFSTISPGVAVQTMDYVSRPSGPLKLDLYSSASKNGALPIVIVLHGGSWQGGNRRDLPDLNYYLAARGYAVASITYRFAPAFPNPAATEDLNAAIDYLKSKAAVYNIDASRIALIGRSAGGHLVLLSAYTRRDAAIRGVVAFYPPIDQYFGYANPSRIIPARRILEDYVPGTPRSNPSGYTSNSPIAHVGRQTPPTLLIHGTKDELVFARQSRMLDTRLATANRPHLLLEMPWATHGCDFVINGPCGQLSTFAIERFLAGVLR